MEFIDMLKKRRSIRQYTKEAVTGEQLQLVINAGLLSPSSRSIRPWELIVVQNKDTLQKMSECRVGSAKMLANASAAVVVIANAEKSDVWTEDCSIVMSNMHLMADSLGVGSCWIQGRLRTATTADSGTASVTTEDYVRECLDFPEGYKLEAILSLGMPAEEKTPAELSKLPFEKIHYEKF